MIEITLNDIANIAQIVIAISTSLGVIGVYIAYKTLKANHDWNRRHLAIEKIIEIQSNLSKLREEEFELLLHFSSRKEPYTLEEIHLLMCEIDENGNIKRDNNGYCILTKKGRKLSSQIREYLNSYEIIAGAIKENTFDEQVIKNILKGNMIKAYKIFQNYINHLRDFYKRPTAFLELENLVKKWENEDAKFIQRNKTA